MGSLEILRYRTAEGVEPFTDWLAGIRDKRIQARIRVRIRRLEAGLFGDSESVGDGVLELREHVGPGYRIYFGRHGACVVILLCGGTKASQARDIRMAQAFWSDWKRRRE